MSTPVHLVVAGVVDDPQFHHCKSIVEMLAKERKDVTSGALPMFEFDWQQYLQEQKLILGGDAFNHQSSAPLVFYNKTEYVGSLDELKTFANATYQIKDQKKTKDFEEIANDEYTKMKAATGHSFCFFEIQIGEELSPQKVVIELFSDESACPRTCTAFLGLCNADEGKGYKGTKFHRVVRDGWVQGGDFMVDGKELPGTIADESFMISFGSSAGIVGLANEGDVHTNRSQFFITMKPMPSLDGKYVAIGRVVSGFQTVKSIEAAELVNEAPVLDCVVKDCGVVL